MIWDTLLIGFFGLMLALMLFGFMFKIGLLHLFASAISIYLMVEMADKHVGEPMQVTALALVFFGLSAFNFWRAFWGVYNVWFGSIFIYRLQS